MPFDSDKLAVIKYLLNSVKPWGGTTASVLTVASGRTQATGASLASGATVLSAMTTSLASAVLVGAASMFSTSSSVAGGLIRLQCIYNF